jgi:hypothetical protein
MNDFAKENVAEKETSKQLQNVNETASTSVAVQARAIIEARYIMAMHHPRDIDTVRERLLKECARPGFAEVAKYNKPVGKGIVGPSIRFTEAAIRCMQNIDVSTMTVYDDREKRIVRVSVCDIESNVPYSQDVTIQKTVERRSKKDGDVVVKERLNSNNQKLYIIEAYDDDILNKQNALISKAIRTLGLRLLPGDILEECMEAVGKTLSKHDSVDPDAAKRKIFDSFSTVGVKVSDIKDWLGHSGESLTPKELQDLRGMYSAIKDGETTWREIMDAKTIAVPIPPELPPANELTALQKFQVAKAALFGKKGKSGVEAITSKMSKDLADYSDVELTELIKKMTEAAK